MGGAGRSLGVSAELCTIETEWNADCRVITKASLHGLAICEVAAATFPQPRCWLCGDDRLIDPHAAALAEGFRAGTAVVR